MDLQKQGSMGFENNSVSTKSFGLKDKVGYLCGDLGNDFTFIFASMYLMIFYTNVWGISPSLVGTLFLVSRCIDAFTDVTMGRIVDKCKTTKDGKLVIGAGTVLDAETARAAMLAGAKYIVSPGFDLETAKICNRYKVPYLPGIMTINEIITAHEAGVDFVKLFPGSAFGQGYVKAIKGPLPYANIMVTGGVNIDNIDSWIKAGVDAVGIGGELNKLGEEGKFEEITAVCEQYMAKLNEARGC
ncbi:MFS transporter [Intestinibacter bartlettii]|uniref:MFS transporter n=1 Tax=Intestinibacter bartlettii TaxID=261299 RepID=UPI0028FE88FD|nr:MFS transporter [Intestinibacter bartlettii]MDU2163256.1 MFS transporter [Intestinibacter bartlettii]